MPETQTLKSTCGLCHGGCGVLVFTEGSKVVRVEGDPESPVNKGRLCPKGAASLKYLYHPDRLKVPLKNTGKRGEGKWREISWNEALDLVANGLLEVRERYGTESIAMVHGYAKGLQDSFLARLANALGTPNVATMGQVCHVPRLEASKTTFGFFPLHDFEGLPKCILVWGFNPENTAFHVYNRILEAREKGSKLVVVDPRRTKLAREADLWIRVRPGSDLALALGMLNIIVTENLFDQDFVERWTIGFDTLKDHVQEYAPEKVERLTWVPKETIVRAAQLYATSRPACIAWGNALDHNVNSFQAGRALSILMAVTGNLEIPGGEIRPPDLPVIKRRSPKLEAWESLPRSVMERRVDSENTLLPSFRYVLPQNLVKAILHGVPYPIRAAYVQGCNPLLTYSNSQDTLHAFKRLDFLAVAELFVTPTARLADILLPVASYLEYDSIVSTPASFALQVQQKVTRIGECRSDYEILKGLADRLGLEDYFWANEEMCLDALLEPAGMSFRELKKKGITQGKKRYRVYEEDNFSTPSGKVELYSSRLKEWGFDPLPEYLELPETPFSEPGISSEYPFLLTSWKVYPFQHSGGRQIDTLRKVHPEPLVHIHPEKAKELGIEEGDRVIIETKRGRIRQKAVFSDALDPRVVGVDYGWWFPEKGPDSLYGWDESNVNVLTENRPPFNPEIGSPNLRGISCKVYKEDSESEDL
ncbi:MAG: molybdopterin-dependent oxidoreductase [Deltaproteobacteria bacterium]|nr:molybdopterin-dependent oxidoreductase [Deltaproteobacteria bacterium]